MRPLISPYYYQYHPSVNSMGYMYNQIGCQFLICESCFLTATIFKGLDKNNDCYRTKLKTCPICSSKNISIISLSTNEDNSSTKCTQSRLKCT